MTCKEKKGHEKKEKKRIGQLKQKKGRKNMTGKGIERRDRKIKINKQNR